MTPEEIEEYYKRVLCACLASGKWSWSEAKKEALCAVRSYKADMAELDVEIDKIVLVNRAEAEAKTQNEGE